MDLAHTADVRRATQQLRRRPPSVVLLRVPFEGAGLLPDDLPLGSLEITLETTNANGETAAWLDDFWWSELLSRWGDDGITLHIAPTPGSLVHPLLLHQIEMVARVARTWRVVGHAYRDDVITDDEIAALARSAYHELRFFDQTRLNTTSSGRLAAALTLEELFGRIRRAQIKVGATRPVLVRLPASAAAPAGEAGVRRNEFGGPAMTAERTAIPTT